MTYKLAFLEINANGKYTWLREAFMRFDEDSMCAVVRCANRLIEKADYHKLGILDALEVLAKIGMWMVKHDIPLVNNNGHQ